MCIEVVVISDGQQRYCTTIGDLRSAFGGEPEFSEGYPPAPEDDLCLCSLDAERTATKFGLVARQATEAEGFPFVTVAFQELT